MLRFCSATRQRRRHRHIQSKILKIERTTDVFIPDTTMEDEVWQGNEAILTRDNQFIGTTAKFTAEGGIIPLREDLRLAGYLLILSLMD
jgi:hypothetical protein